MPTQAERLRIKDYFQVIFPDEIGTGLGRLTGKCFNCGKNVFLGIDGAYEDKECCNDCFLLYFR